MPYAFQKNLRFVVDAPAYNPVLSKYLTPEPPSTAFEEGEKFSALLVGETVILKHSFGNEIGNDTFVDCPLNVSAIPHCTVGNGNRTEQ